MESCSPGDGNGDMGTLLVLAPKSVRNFTTNYDYLYAMKEDLAEWFKALYKHEVTAENFFEELETGVLLCEHANEVVQHYRHRRQHGGVVQMKSYFVRDVPEAGVQFRANVKPGTFQARDNVSNFISWCVQLGIPDVIRFETEDLVMRKNEKSVVLCLLEVARVGAKMGMLAPTLVQMEEEIDAELATGEPPPQVITCDLKSLDELVRELVGRCSCPIQFQLIKVGDGKYKIGDSQTLIFVRILRNHVMVRVGGGWDTLEHYLDKHDPCRCNFSGHRPGPSQRLIQSRRGSVPCRITPPRTTTPTPGGSGPAVNMKSPRKMSVPSLEYQKSSTSGMRCKSPGLPSSSALRSKSPGPPSSRSKSPGPPSARSKSPAPGGRKLPVPQDLSYTPNSSQNASQLGRKSPAPSRLRSPSPVSQGRKLPVPNKANGIPAARRSMSPEPSSRETTHTGTRSSGLSKTAPCTPRKMSMDALNAEDDPGDESSINMNEISTMTLEQFRNLLNKQLSVPPAGEANGTSLSSDSPRSQEGSDSSKTMSSRTANATSSWRAVREKARSVCQSLESSVGARGTRTSSSNDSGYLSQNGENTPKRTLPHRPKTPTSSSSQRPKTPVSKSSTFVSDSRPKTPTNYSRPKTPTSGYQRTRTPSNSAATTPSSVDEYKVFSSKDDRPQPERPSTPSSLVPRPSGIPRPSTPTSQVVATGRTSDEQRVSARPMTPGTARKQLPARPASTVPQEKSYMKIFQSRRSSTPGPGTNSPRVSEINPRRTSLGSRDRGEIISRPSAVSRSLDFSSKRSQSVMDVRDNLSMMSVDGPASDDESDSRSKSRTVSASDVRQGVSSVESRKFVRQKATDDSSFTVSRTNSGAHKITLTENSTTKYQTGKGTNRFVRSSSSDNCESARSRQRARTPDPSMLRQGMTRRKSELSIPSGKSIESRTEAWVNSTVNDTKRKLPTRPKRSMTPNSMNRMELELSSRPLDEIKEALRAPLENGVAINPNALEAPPGDAKAYLQMEKLFQMLKEKELRQSVNNTVGGSCIDVRTQQENMSQGILKNSESKAASSKSLNSVRFSNSSLSSLSSGQSKSISSSSNPTISKPVTSPINHSSSFTSFSPSSNGHHLTSTPVNGVSSSGVDDDSGDEETHGNTADVLVSKLKEMAKLRPRKESSCGLKSRIPAPNLSKNRKSKSFSNLSTSLSFSKPESFQRASSETSNEDCAVFYNPDEEDDLSELARIAQDREELMDRSETPVPRLATPLTTGRSTFLNMSKEKVPRLVRAVSQDRSPSNSMSSLSSHSLSTIDNEHEYV